MGLGEKYFLIKPCKITKRKKNKTIKSLKELKDLHIKKYFLVLESFVPPQNSIIIVAAPHYKWLRIHRILPASQFFISPGALLNSFEDKMGYQVNNCSVNSHALGICHLFCFMVGHC